MILAYLFSSNLLKEAVSEGGAESQNLVQCKFDFILYIFFRPLAANFQWIIRVVYIKHHHRIMHKVTVQSDVLYNNTTIACDYNSTITQRICTINFGARGYVVANAQSIF